MQKSRKKPPNKYFKVRTKNKNPTYRTLWDAEKTVPREKFISLYAYIRKKDLNSIILQFISLSKH